MFIPRIVINAATFPGVVIREFGHQVFCRMFRIPVFDVCYFRFANPSGYVVHERVERAYQEILIAIGPWFVNTILAILIGASAAINTIVDASPTPIDWILFYLAISIGMHAFPRAADAKAIWERVVVNSDVAWYTRGFAVPVIGLVYLGALGSQIWLDAAYAIVLVVWVPRFLFHVVYC